MESILDPLLAVLSIVLPIWLVYGLLALQDRLRKRKKVARHAHFLRARQRHARPAGELNRQ